MRRLGRRARQQQQQQQQQPPPPRTVVGLWLRALLVDDVPERDRLLGQLNGGKKGWNTDEAGVMQATCNLAVDQYFGSDYDVRQITEEVTFLREADLTGGKTPHGQLEMEAVVRHALGETDIDISGINAQVAFEVQGAFTFLIALRLGWQEPQVVQLVTTAEQIAFAHGWKPPLAAGAGT